MGRKKKFKVENIFNPVESALAQAEVTEETINKVGYAGSIWGMMTGFKSWVDKKAEDKMDREKRRK